MRGSEISEQPMLKKLRNSRIKTEARSHITYHLMKGGEGVKIKIKELRQFNCRSD